jgi:hypothetical protein
MIMLLELTPASVTAFEDVPAPTVRMPLRLNFAFPVTCRAVPLLGASW